MLPSHFVFTGTAQPLCPCALDCSVLLTSSAQLFPPSRIDLSELPIADLGLQRPASWKREPTGRQGEKRPRGAGEPNFWETPGKRHPQKPACLRGAGPCEP